MKKLMFLNLLMFSGIVFAQPTIQPKINPKVITLMPNTGGQGYLVLNQKMNSDVVIWQLELMQRFYSNDTTYEDKVIKRTELSGVNYIKIPKNYLNQKDTYYSIKVLGLNSEKKIVAEVDGASLSVFPPAAPGGGPVYDETGNWKCNGKTYAWEIQQYTSDDYFDPNDPATPVTLSSFQMESTFNYFDANIGLAIPYYQYMSESEFNIVQNNTNKWDYYNLVQSDVQAPYNGVKVIRIYNNPNVNNYDVNNQLITSQWIYGVQKFLGPWGIGYAPAVQIDYLPLGDQTGVPIDQIIGLMNSHYDFIGKGFGQNLSCNEFGINPPQVPEADLSKCMEAYYDFQIGVDGDIFDQLDQLHDCIYGTTSDEWGDDDGGSIINVNVNSLSSDVSISLNRNDFFASNGEFVLPSFVLKEGLYSIGVYFKDGTYIPLIREVKGTVNNQYELSNFLQATIYPVPVQGDQFEINMPASG